MISTSKDETNCNYCVLYSPVVICKNTFSNFTWTTCDWVCLPGHVYGCLGTEGTQMVRTQNVTACALQVLGLPGVHGTDTNCRCMCFLDKNLVLGTAWDLHRVHGVHGTDTNCRCMCFLDKNLVLGTAWDLHRVHGVHGTDTNCRCMCFLDKNPVLGTAWDLHRVHENWKLLIN